MKVKGQGQLLSNIYGTAQWATNQIDFVAYRLTLCSATH